MQPWSDRRCPICQQGRYADVSYRHAGAPASDTRFSTYPSSGVEIGRSRSRTRSSCSGGVAASTTSRIPVSEERGVDLDVGDPHLE